MENNDEYEIIKPVELHTIYGMKDFIVPCENTIIKMTENIKLPYEIYYHNNLKNTRKCKFFRNHDGTKENRCVTFYENGNIESITHYHNGILNGRFQTFYPCGSLKDEGYYINNQLHIYYITFYHPNIARNRIYSYIEYTNGQIMGRHSIYMVDGSLYKEQYIYQNLMLHDIENPRVYLDKCTKNNKEYILRVLMVNDKIVTVSRYILYKYDNDNNIYYIFNKHLGFPYIERKNLSIAKDKIIFTFHYDRKNRNMIVSMNEKDIVQLQKIC